MSIERDILQALHGAEKGSVQDQEGQDLLGRLNLAVARGFKDPEPIPEGGRLSPEQIKGLEVVRFNFVVPIAPKSVLQLEAENPNHLGYITPSDSVRTSLPQAGTVAFMSGQVELPDTGKLSFDDKREEIAKYWRKLQRTKMPKGATLEGVNLDLASHASILVQGDIRSQKITGRPLLVGIFGQTQETTSGSYVADVGRNPGNSRLDVSGWNRRDGRPRVGAVPVARPARK